MYRAVVPGSGKTTEELSPKEVGSKCLNAPYHVRHFHLSGGFFGCLEVYTPRHVYTSAYATYQKYVR